MKILQVKEYNETIAENKWRNCEKTHCLPSMFYFYLDNEQTRRYGYNIKRQKGYIAFNETKAVFGMNREKAIERFTA